ncbi:hypothetical protein [Streptomyces sp. NPDC053813]|uniref:hypothetical protein n=1 Tax=Streptomyces sp. NPDC053813 TaxID=3365717 RepID=UPI0037D3C6CD
MSPSVRRQVSSETTSGKPEAQGDVPCILRFDWAISGSDNAPCLLFDWNAPTKE